MTQLLRRPSIFLSGSLSGSLCGIPSAVPGTLLALALSGCPRPSPTVALPPAPPPVQPDPAPPKLRLPSYAAPTRYEVTLTIDPRAQRFRGQMDIHLRVSEATPVLWINGSELTVHSAQVLTAGVAQPARVLPPSKHFLGFALPRALPPGEHLLRIDYSAPMSSQDSAGLFRQQEGGDWYVFSDFEPIDARRAFPCFDEPSFKAPWHFNLRIPRDLRAFTNAPQVSESGADREARSAAVEGEGLKLLRFAPTAPISSYLVALAVGPFDVVDAGPVGQRRTPLRILTPKGRAAEARYAVSVTGQLLERLEAYFGSPYPYAKLDLIAIPQISGAMENPGLITFRQSILLASPREQTLRFQRGYAQTATHELAHQWFGDLVTMKFWDDIWLNESFASWLEGKITDAWQPAWGLRQSSVAMRSGAMGADSLVSARRIRQPIESEDDIANAFDGITYNKGKAVLEMFEGYLGEDAFRRGVRRYLRTHENNNATASDFLQALSQEAGRDVSAPFQTFLDQAGVPLVSVALRCSAGAPPQVVLQQQRYLPLGSPASAKESAQRWQIPLCVKYPGAKEALTTCTLLQTEEATLPLPEAPRCPAWVMANASPQGGAGGYYRVRYPSDVLGRLWAQAPRGPALTAAERLTILSDQIALVRTNQLPAAEALALLPALFKAPDRHLLSQAGGLLGLLDPLVPQEERPAFRKLLRGLAAAPARALGLRARPNDDEDTRLLRPQLLGMAAGGGQDPQLVAEAGRLARAWLDDRNSVDTDLTDQILNIAAQHGDLALFQRYREAATREPERRTRRRLYGAMGGFRAPEAVQAVLALLLSEEVDVRDAIGALGELLDAPETRERAYGFLTEHFDALTARLPRDSGAWLTRMAAGSFCSAAHQQRLEAFFGPKASRFAGGPRVLAQTLERVHLCDALKQAQQPSLVAFLRKAR